MVITISALILTTDDACAWTQSDINFTDGDYTSGRVYNFGPQYDKTPLINNSNWAGMYISNTYWGYLSIPLDQFEDNIRIRSAVVNFYAYGTTDPSDQIQVKLMAIDPRYAAAETIWVHMDDSYDLGKYRIQYDYYQYYRVDLTGKALDMVRDQIAGDHRYLTIGFQYYNTNAYVYQRYYGQYSFVRFQYDNSPPEVPTLDVLDAYSTGDTLSISWSSVSDLPTGGNVGGVKYQLGIFLNASDYGNPWYTTQWSATTSWDLFQPEDGRNYHFRVRARDGSGFTSNWSSPVNSTVDNSAPTTPHIQPEPAYTNSTENIITWGPSEDAGIGNVSYEYQYSLDYTFPGEIYHHTTETSVTVTGLIDTTYYYRVRALDGFGHESAWSYIERSTQDSSPPSIPVPLPMPTFSKDDSSFFSWAPAMDEGVGVDHYDVERVWRRYFSPNLTENFTTTGTLFVSKDLIESPYRYRVRAVDTFGFMSPWSEPIWSTQDASPPSAPVIHDLPDYLPEGPVTLFWAPAIDHGVGVSHYEVWYYKQGPPGSSPMVVSFEVLGQSLTLPDLTEGKWNFGVMAVDRAGQTGPPSSENTTVDTTPPSAPVMEDVPKFTNWTHLTLRWSPSTDDSGVSHYEVSCHPEGAPEAVWLIETIRTWATFPGLVDGKAYWYSVRAYDVVGNFVDDRWWMSTVDTSPPAVPMVDELLKYINGDVVHITWQESLDKQEGLNWGVGSVQYRVYWDVVMSDGGRTEDLSGDSGWIDETFYLVEGLGGGREYWFVVQARDGLGHVSAPSDEVTTTLVTLPPMVMVTYPFDMATLSGVVNVMGLCYKQSEDVYFSIDIGVSEEGPWVPLFPILTETKPNGFIFQWDTTRFPDGVHVLRVTLTDEVGLNGTTRVNVTIANAIITVSPSDIALTDWNPDMEDPPMLMVVVWNHGDSEAWNLSVHVYVGTKVLEITDGIYVDGHSYTELYYDLEYAGRQRITVRVTSDLYDTGDVFKTLTIEEVDEEQGDTAMTMSIIALILAVMALFIALLMARRPPVEVPDGTEGEGVE